jgi:HEAT repeat protein
MLDESDHALVRDALMALGMVGAVDVSERIAKFAADPENLVRAQVATSLGKLHAPQARAVLTTLVRDDDRYVKQSAARQYGALPDADPAVVRELLAQTERSRVGELTAEGLAEARTPQALELLQGFLLANGGTNEMFSSLDAHPGPEVTALMRALLASTIYYVRERAIRHLGKTGDVADAPAIRALLSGETIGEREAAAAALAAVNDRESIPALEGMLHDSNPNGRVAAAQALVALRATESIPALEAIISTDSSWAKPQLEKLLAELRAASAP